MITEITSRPGSSSNPGTPSGGATSTLGTPGRSLHVQPFNELTRRMTRQDMMEYLLCPDNKTMEEQRLLQKMAFYGAGGMSLAGVVTYWLAGKLPWHHFNSWYPPKAFVPFSRTCLAFCAASIPYVLSQQWGIAAIMKLPEDSQLSFMTRRYLMTQRGSVMFTRSEVREVTKQEMAEYGGVGAQDPRNAHMQAPPPGGGMNAEYTLSQEQFLPIAQSGYKPPPV